MLNLIAVLIFATVCLATLALYQSRQKRSLREIIRGSESGLEQTVPEPERDSFLDRWERAALQAGLGWKRSFYYTVAGAGTGIATMLWLTGSPVLGMMAGATALLGPAIFVFQKQAARRALFGRQLPQALFLAASVLRAGGTLMQAVDSIAAEMPDPMGAEFRRIQAQMRLQVPAHEAMAEAQQRIGLREFAAVVVAARITNEVGGNMAHIFDQVARSIVEAQNARRMVQAFTTEGRMSANVIAALPFVVMGLLMVLSPGYFGPMFESLEGKLVFGLCTGAILFGWYIIRRMVNIRIF